MMDPSVIAALRTHLAANPWDADAWDSLAGVAAATGTIDQQREIYEQITEHFPTAVRLRTRAIPLEPLDRQRAPSFTSLSTCAPHCSSSEHTRPMPLTLRPLLVKNKPTQSVIVTLSFALLLCQAPLLRTSSVDVLYLSKRREVTEYPWLHAATVRWSAPGNRHARRQTPQSVFRIRRLTGPDSVYLQPLNVSKPSPPVVQAIYWQRYAELELDESDSSRAKLVFSRCLLTCPHIKLWSLYLRFIKKVLCTSTARTYPQSIHIHNHHHF